MPNGEKPAATLTAGPAEDPVEIYISPNENQHFKRLESGKCFQGARFTGWSSSARPVRLKGERVCPPYPLQPIGVLLDLETISVAIQKKFYHGHSLHARELLNNDTRQHWNASAGSFMEA